MNTRIWMRLGFGFGVVSLAGAGMIVACSSDSTTPTAADSGTPDAQTVDANRTDTGPAPIHPKVALLHAAANVGAVIPCLSILGQYDALRPALSILPGAATQPLDPGYDLSQVPVEASLILASSSKVPRTAGGSIIGTCADLLSTKAGGPGLVEGVDYLKLPTIAPVGTLKQGETTLFVAVGCLPNGATNPTKCGLGYTDAGDAGLGNFHIEHVQLAPANGTTNGVQFAHFSTETLTLPLNLWLEVNYSDGGIVLEQPLNVAPVGFGQIGDVPPRAVAKVNDASALDINTGFRVSQYSDGGGIQYPPPGTNYPLASALKGTDYSADGGPAFVQPGRNYTVMFTGDFAAPQPWNPYDASTAHTSHFVIVDNGP